MTHYFPIKKQHAEMKKKHYETSVYLLFLDRVQSMHYLNPKKIGCFVLRFVFINFNIKKIANKMIYFSINLHLCTIAKI